MMQDSIKPRRRRVGIKPPPDCLTLHEAAVELERPLTLFTNWLRVRRYTDGNLYPNPQLLQMDLLDVRTWQYCLPSGMPKHYSRTFVTRKGMTWLRSVLPSTQDMRAEVSL
ncbi:hypothetical protein [Plasticicumulans acidivorans]|uniref:Phage antirepressor protein KilAC domain-containing protein n=1 Tax=Plasticicumulans acidivorans TaxID=886464 RepID=A0A317N1L8_9GAMM|nr:hypothetical protein [Plasticicumulans acidivorans]PWV66024.1 hypothetical protein C7443_101512 [Plasticicumulans acidivorans]